MDNFDARFLAADQCRARADLIRQTAETMKSETVRLNLRRLAERYNEMAARIEKSAETVA
jgi:hypothetical protein